nr:EOG090X0BFL [Ilyocryptus agilis]
MEEIEMVQKAMAKREEAGKFLSKVGTTVATTKKAMALKRHGIIKSFLFIFSFVSYNLIYIEYLIRRGKHQLDTLKGQALLLLPEEFTLKDLFLKITSLSYQGDFRITQRTEKIEQAVRTIVSRSSITQTLKGVLTAGFLRSSRYAFFLLHFSSFVSHGESRIIHELFPLFIQNSLISTWTIGYALPLLMTLYFEDFAVCFLLFLSIYLSKSIFLAGPKLAPNTCSLIEWLLMSMGCSSLFLSTNLHWWSHFEDIIHRPTVVIDYVVCLLLFGLIVSIFLRNLLSTNNHIEKYFHFLAIIVYTSGIFIDRQLLIMCSVAFVVLLLLLECIKVKKVPPLGEIIGDAWNIYENEKDVGPLMVSHLFLIIGLSYPVWLADNNRRLAQMSGIISVGIGDSVASIVGSKIGRHRWPGRKRTLEGSLAGLIAQFSFIVLLWSLGVVPYSQVNLWFVSAGLLLITQVEAWSDDIDNLTLPIILFPFLYACETF